MEAKYAWQLTPEEFGAERAKGTCIISFEGHILCSDQRKIEDKESWRLYHAEFAKAVKRGVPMRSEVIASNNAVSIPMIQEGAPAPVPEAVGSVPRPTILPDGLPLPPAIVPPTPPVLNAKGRTFSWSYSAMSDWDGTFGCPKKYAEARFYCRTPYKESKEQKYGNDVHKAGEMFVHCGEITNQEFFALVEQYARLFRAQKEAGAEVTPELEIVFDKDMNLMQSKDAWFSDDAWFRMKIDVPIIKGNKASIFDYKTGGTIREDYEQLHLCMAALAIARPEIEEFSGKLIWTKFQEVTGCPDLDRAGAMEVWEKALVRVERMEAAWEHDNFPARRNGLCKNYCQVISCINCG